MNDLTVFLVEVSISLILSAIILILISKPLKSVLKSLCSQDNQALFWMIYTKIMIYIAPLLLVITVGTFFPADDVIMKIKIAFILSLLGVVLGLSTISKRVLKVINKDIK